MNYSEIIPLIICFVCLLVIIHFQQQQKQEELEESDQEKEKNKFDRISDQQLNNNKDKDSIVLQEKTYKPYKYSQFTFGGKGAGAPSSQQRFTVSNQEGTCLSHEISSFLEKLDISQFVMDFDFKHIFQTKNCELFLKNLDISDLDQFLKSCIVSNINGENFFLLQHEVGLFPEDKPNVQQDQFDHIQNVFKNNNNENIIENNNKEIEILQSRQQKNIISDFNYQLKDIARMTISQELNNHSDQKLLNKNEEDNKNNSNTHNSQKIKSHSSFKIIEDLDQNLNQLNKKINNDDDNNKLNQVKIDQQQFIQFEKNFGESFKIEPVNEEQNQIKNQKFYNVGKYKLTLYSLITNLIMYVKSSKKSQYRLEILNFEIINKLNDQQIENINKPQQYSLTLNILNQEGEQLIVLQIKNNESRDLYLIKNAVAQMQRNVFQSISHEISTYLGIIRSLTESCFLNSKNIEEEFFNTILIPISNNITILESIFRDCKDYNQILMDQCIQVQYRRMNMVQQIENLVEIFQSKTILKDIMIELKIENNIPPIIYTDEQKLNQIMINLIQNAIKFTQPGGEITIILKFEKTQNCVSITVKDNGIGMTNEELTRLSRTINEYGILDKVSYNSVGHGFGLIISNILSKILGNQIQFTSEKNVGTSFSFLIDCNNNISYDLMLNCNLQESIQAGKNNQNRALFTKKQKDLNVISSQTGSLMLQDHNLNGFNKLGSPRIKKLAKLAIYNFKSPNEEKKSDSENNQDMLNKNVENDTKQPTSQLQKNLLTCENLNESDMNDDPDKEFNLPTFISQFSSEFKILIVDDEPFNIYSLEMNIKRLKLGIKVETAENGQKCIEILKKQQKIKNLHNQYKGYLIKLIILDINMPIMNGWDTFKKIQEMYQSNEYPIRPFIVAYTAYNDYNTQQQCKTLGFNYFVNKPCSIDELTYIIQQFYFNNQK